MASKPKTVIVTGGSQGIGAGVVRSFLDRGYKVVANSRNITKLDTFIESDHLALGDFFDQPKVADAASELFRDVLGEDKTSVRMVLGVASLPLGVPAVLDVIMEVAA
jgi:NAD(P)-dependent dehydrogenase (short-subunit alcohol dehydrogenase family)